MGVRTFWTEERVAHLKSKFEQLGKSKRKFMDWIREEINNPKSFMFGKPEKVVINAISYHQIIDAPSDVHCFKSLSPDDKKKLKEDMENGGLSWSGVIKKWQNKIPGISRSRLSSYALAEGISTNKPHGRYSKNQTSGKPFGAKIYDSRLSELINDLSLVNRGFSFVFSEIQKHLSASGVKVGRREVRRRIEELIWTPSQIQNLTDSIRNGVNIDKFKEYNQHIPLDLIKKQARKIVGVPFADRKAIGFIKGIGRLGLGDTTKDDETFTLQTSSGDKPIILDCGPDAKNWSIGVLNGTNFGLKYNPVIRENATRRALADARKRGDTAVFITNALSLDSKRVGGDLKIYKSLLSGLTTNFALMPPEYRQIAKAIDAERPDDEVVYEILAEACANILGGWSKVSHRPNGEPTFPGKVYIVLGFQEEEYVNSVAYAEIRMITILRQERLRAEVRLITRAIKNASTQQEEARLQKRKDQLMRELVARTRITNVRSEDVVRLRNRIMAKVVRKFEEAIPNSKVIGIRDLHVKIGQNQILFHLPGNLNPSNTVLAKFVGSYGARDLRSGLPGTVVICHAYSLHYGMTVRERFTKDGQRDDIQFFVAPMAIDAKYLRRQFSDQVRAVHPIQKAIYKERFESGVLRLRCIDGEISPEICSIPSIDPALTKRQKSASNIYPDQKFIWTMIATDQHWGSRSKEFVWDPSTNNHLGTFEAVARMMADAGVNPVHIWTTNDDPTQGNHFETHKQPSPHQLSYVQIRSRILDLKKAMSVENDPVKLREINDELGRLALEQIQIRGIDWPQDQVLELFERHIVPHENFFEAILRNAIRARLNMRGVSQFLQVPHDSRDVGFINFGTGNHFEATIDRSLTEGILYADKLISTLKNKNFWLKRGEELRRMVRAPLYSNQFFAWGTVQAPGGYEWGLAFASEPPRMSSWDDPLMGAINNHEHRGNYAAFMQDRVTLHTYGDKHFFAGAITPHSIYIMSAAGTHTDLYGERGFPHNNTGVTFIGLPVDGPDAGPILHRTLRIKHIVNYFKHPHRFPWETFLPNPV